MYHGVCLGRLPSGTWGLRRARVGGARLFHGCSHAPAQPFPAAAFPAAGSTRLARPGSPPLPSRVSASVQMHEIPSNLEEELGRTCQPWNSFLPPNFPSYTEHKGVSEGEFPLLLHSRDLERRKGNLSQRWVPRRAGGVPCPACEPIRDSSPLHGADPDRGRGLGPLCHTLPQ